MKCLILILLVCEIGVYATGKQRLVGAKNAEIGAYPYQVSLRIKRKNFCGGALITKRHILTAAHCVYQVKHNPLVKKYFTIVVGTNSLIYGGESYTASNFSYYKKYVHKPKDPDFMYDIGIITLDKEVELSKLVKIVPLPRKNIKGGEDAVVTGWGSTRSADSLVSRELQYLNVRIISNSKCKLYYHGVRHIEKSQICAFNGRGYGTCTSDSGGPLVFNGEVVGVISGGVACAKGFPDIYTRVSYYRDYIKEIVASDLDVDKIE